MHATSTVTGSWSQNLRRLDPAWSRAFEAVLSFHEPLAAVDRNVVKWIRATTTRQRVRPPQAAGT